MDISENEKSCLIEKMISFKLNLENYKTCEDENLKYIYRIINKYILDNCNHDIVHDSIDMDLDTSIIIYYCTKCYNTLQQK
jgi:hypothetical protein